MPPLSHPPANFQSKLLSEGAGPGEGATGVGGDGGSSDRRLEANQRRRPAHHQELFDDSSSSCSSAESGAVEVSSGIGCSAEVVVVEELDGPGADIPQLGPVHVVVPTEPGTAAKIHHPSSTLPAKANVIKMLVSQVDMARRELGIELRAGCRPSYFACLGSVSCHRGTPPLNLKQACTVQAKLNVRLPGCAKSNALRKAATCCNFKLTAQT